MPIRRLGIHKQAPSTTAAGQKKNGCTPLFWLEAGGCRLEDWESAAGHCRRLRHDRKKTAQLLPSGSRLEDAGQKTCNPSTVVFDFFLLAQGWKIPLGGPGIHN